jgi:hypothetical protein
MTTLGDIPDDVLALIIGELETKQVQEIRRVETNFRRVIDSEDLVNKQMMKKFDILDIRNLKEFKSKEDGDLFNLDEDDKTLKISLDFEEPDNETLMIKKYGHSYKIYRYSDILFITILDKLYIFGFKRNSTIDLKFRITNNVARIFYLPDIDRIYVIYKDEKLKILFLQFGNNFNTNIPLPNSMQLLQFGNNFNTNIPLPNSMQYSNTNQASSTSTNDSARKRYTNIDQRSKNKQKGNKLGNNDNKYRYFDNNFLIYFDDVGEGKCIYFGKDKISLFMKYVRRHWEMFPEIDIKLESLGDTDFDRETSKFIQNLDSMTMMKKYDRKVISEYHKLLLEKL